MADEPASDTSHLDPASRRVGTVLDGKWTLDHLLGVGGMAAVYAATHRNGARAAIKLFPFSVTTSAEFAERILREGYLANKIGHEAIVRVLDDHLDREREYAYLVMELLDGETARQRVERGGPMSPIEAVEFFIELADCLAAAHDKGVVHRDIKPENLFITKDRHLKVLDFGVARAMDSTSTSVTRTGAMLGTPAYMSPEQARGRPSELSSRSDIYSAGATLLFLVAGEFIHEGESAQEIMVRSAWTPPKKMSERRLGIPAPIAAIIDRACEFDPKDRYQTAAEMWSDLESARDVLAGDPKSTEPIARTSKIPPPRGPVFTAPLPLNRPTPSSAAERTVADLTPTSLMQESSWALSTPRRRATIWLSVAGALLLAAILAATLRAGNHSEPTRAAEPRQPPLHAASSAVPTPTHEEVTVPLPTAVTLAPGEAASLPNVPSRVDGTKRRTLVARSDDHRPTTTLHAPATSSVPSVVPVAIPSARMSPVPPAIKPTGRDVGY